MLKFNKLFTCKIISIIVIITFTVTNICYGIDLPNKSHLRAPLSGNTEEGKERFKHALLYEIRNILGSVIRADEEKDLEFYGEIRKTLLLENGKILLNEELYDDYVSRDLTREGKAVQVIIHELIEVLLQVTKEQNPPRYQSIKELALNNLVELYRKTFQGQNTYEDEVLVNDILSLIFEYRLMGIDPKTIEDANLKDLLLKGYEIINARGDLFREEFNSLHYAKEKVLEGLGKGIRLSKAGEGESKISAPSTIVKSDATQIQNSIKSLRPDFHGKRKLNVEEFEEHVRQEAKKLGIEYVHVKSNAWNAIPINIMGIMNSIINRKLLDFIVHTVGLYSLNLPLAMILEKRIDIEGKEALCIKIQSPGRFGFVAPLIFLVIAIATYNFFVFQFIMFTILNLIEYFLSDRCIIHELEHAYILLLKYKIIREEKIADISFIDTGYEDTFSLLDLLKRNYIDEGRIIILEQIILDAIDKQRNLREAATSI